MTHKYQNQSVQHWLTWIKQKTCRTGKLAAQDDFGGPIIVEWKRTDILSPHLAEFKKCICEMASQNLAPLEIAFLRAHPDGVSQEMFLQPCAPLFEKGLDFVDWQAVEEKIKSTIKQFYLTDLSSFAAEVIKPLLNDVYFYATIRNSNSQQLLGFIMFAITPALEFGHIKIIHISLVPEQQNRGLEKRLTSAIFRIVPSTMRLFLYVRPTNDREIHQYCDWGFIQEFPFTQDPNHPINTDYLIRLEYRTEKSDSLQKTAMGFEDLQLQRVSS